LFFLFSCFYFYLFIILYFSIVPLFKLIFFCGILVCCVFFHIKNVFVSLLLFGDAVVCRCLLSFIALFRWSSQFCRFSLCPARSVLCCIQCCSSFVWCICRFWFWFVLLTLIFWEVLLGRLPFLRFSFMIWLLSFAIVLKLFELFIFSLLGESCSRVSDIFF